ncbi:hypothetical protein FSP39_021301 [Pinctada imbricata]|uniref:AMP-dependent synthetase/ligase domain-containing protein n=1 Tax=Pinctada imbricata TaxID=66713 RepID=A0AA88XXT3_PINIB|nr:hypothetical protein FSP39_021301 [Pinctada imbricata]
MAMSSNLSYMTGRQLPSARNFYSTVPEMMKHHSLDQNKVVHIYYDWETGDMEKLTYKTLYDNARKFAKGLLRLGIKKGHLVGLAGENIPEWTYAAVGLQLCGAIPLNFFFNKTDGKDVEGLLKSAGSECKAIIFPPGKSNINLAVVEKIFEEGNERGEVVSETLPSIKLAVILKMHYESERYLDMESVIANVVDQTEFPALDPDDIATIFMTSGSLGIPKLVQHSHRNILIFGHQVRECLGSEAEKIFNDRSFCWIVGFLAWESYTGKTRVIIRNVTSIPSMQVYHDVVKKIVLAENCHSVIMIIPLLQEILNRGTFDWRIPKIVTAGQPVPSTLATLTGKACDCFSVLYGCTEIGCIAEKVAYKPEDFMDYEVGDPVQGVEVKVVDREGNVVECDEEGELYVRSQIRFLGYLNNETKSHAVNSKSGWYKTDDSVKMMKTGRFIVNGRMKDSIAKVGPRFVSLAAIEIQLKKHPGISDVIVFSYIDELHYHCVCCAIISKENTMLSKAELDEYLLDKAHRTEANLMQKLELPRSYAFLKAFPRTFSGKVDRRQVAEMSKQVLFEHSNQ